MPDAELAYGEHRLQVFNYFRRCGLPGDVAEDLTQSTFATLLETIGRYEPARGSLVGYIYGIARNHRRAFWRTFRRRQGPEAEAACVEPARGNADTVAMVRGAVESLQDDRREALVLREFQGLSYAEIAAVQDVPIGTVRSRIARAREDLRAQLQRGEAAR